MKFTDEQIRLMDSENPKVVLTLENEKVLAFSILIQMHNKVVRMADNFFGNTNVGVFTIDELNGNTELDFSNPDDWKSVNVESITYSIQWLIEGTTCKHSFKSIFNIKKIELFEQL